MKLFRSFFSNAIFFLNILLLFLLFFRNRLSVPIGLLPLGRMHPLLLHLPIGILLLVVMMLLFRRGFKKKSFRSFLNFALYFAALTAALSAILGVMLSTEGGYEETILNKHILWGAGVSLLAWITLELSLIAPDKKTLLNYVVAASTVSLVLAGHYGSVLTHGENFIFSPLSESTPEDATVMITDSTSFYDAAVYPVLQKKCTSCHNEKKAKGGLVMTSKAKITAGGEDGPLWIKGDPDRSLLIKRIHLPEGDDDRMPPAGKPALTQAEMELFSRWIKSGADMSRPWTKYAPEDSLATFVKKPASAESAMIEKHYRFTFADAATIESLNTPFCTVTQLAADEPAVSAEFFLAKDFDSKKLATLLKIKEQLISLDLAGMPLTDQDAETLRAFANLEKINLNKTTLTKSLSAALASLQHLSSISLAGATVDKLTVSDLASSGSVHKIFLWNTSLSQEDITTLKKQFAGVQFDAGYHTDEILRLTAPQLLNESVLIKLNDEIRLKHSMPGTTIRYTTDGSAPDSISSTIFKVSTPIDGYTHLRARAFREGWYGSPELDLYFFKQGLIPIDVMLDNPPSKDYRGEGAASLIDGKKGSGESFRDNAWMAFREKPFVASFQLPAEGDLQTITLSYLRMPGSFLLPPSTIEVWGGDDAGHLQLLKQVAPVQPEKNWASGAEGLLINIPKAHYNVIKIIAQPVPKVPTWISKKPEKGWFFIDEVLFN